MVEHSNPSNEPQDETEITALVCREFTTDLTHIKDKIYSAPQRFK